MKNKKIIYALLCLGITIIIGVYTNVYASKNQTKINLIDGINKISYESRLLRRSRAENYKKLKQDLDIFYEKGSSKIDSKNMFYALSTPDFTAEEYEGGLAGTGLAGLAKDFKEVGEEYGINPILLMAMAKHETGNGSSELFKNKNNLFGFNAVDHDPYNQATDFNSPKESIETVAKHLKENYLKKDGPYYKGVSTDAIAISYATDPDWSKKVNWMMIEVAESMIDEFEDGAVAK